MEDNKLKSGSRERSIDLLLRQIAKLEEKQHEAQDTYSFASIGREICLFEEMIIMKEYEDVQTRTKMYVDMMVKSSDIKKE